MKKVMLTCYDAAFAKICADTKGLDYILVGDSLGMVLYGADSTLDVSLDDMARHTRAVRRGLNRSEVAEKPLLVADLPAHTYDDPQTALKSAAVLKEAGAEMIKLEGPKYEVVSYLRERGIRVCGHIGLTPQTIHHYKVQGKTEEDAKRLLVEAESLEKAGCELLVLEMVPAVLARKITDQLKISTIGIGAGPYCDGQVLVLYDVLGLDPTFSPRFLKKYFNAHDSFSTAIQAYANDVKEQRFPTLENSF